ncbi:MAG: hypothetical protein HQK51_20035 [Oligoflexia bacterium]|nr:hypothetical protein [Oligoflexia bacterium]
MSIQKLLLNIIIIILLIGPLTSPLFAFQCFVVSGMKADFNGALKDDILLEKNPQIAGSSCLTFDSWTALKEHYQKTKQSTIDEDIMIYQGTHGGQGGYAWTNTERTSPDKIIEVLELIGANNRVGYVAKSCYSGDLLMNKMSLDEVRFKEHTPIPSLGNVCILTMSAPGRSTTAGTLTETKGIDKSLARVQPGVTMEEFFSTEKEGLFSSAPWSQSGLIRYYQNNSIKNGLEVLQNLEGILSGSESRISACNDLQKIWSLLLYANPYLDEATTKVIALAWKEQETKRFKNFKEFLLDTLESLKVPQYISNESLFKIIELHEKEIVKFLGATEAKVKKEDRDEDEEEVTADQLNQSMDCIKELKAVYGSQAKIDITQLYSTMQKIGKTINEKYTAKGIDKKNLIDGNVYLRSMLLKIPEISKYNIVSSQFAIQQMPIENTEEHNKILDSSIRKLKSASSKEEDKMNGAVKKLKDLFVRAPTDTEDDYSPSLNAIKALQGFSRVGQSIHEYSNPLDQKRREACQKFHIGKKKEEKQEKEKKEEKKKETETRASIIDNDFPETIVDDSGF